MAKKSKKSENAKPESGGLYLHEAELALINYLCNGEGWAVMTNQKCESCRRGFDGRNGNGYSPCSCNKLSIINGPEIQLVPAKPDFVPPPPLVRIGRPRLGWKPKPFNPDPYANFNKLLLIIIMVCLVVMGFVMGCLYATSYVS